MVNVFLPLARWLNRALLILSTKIYQTDMSNLTEDIWEGYRPNWTSGTIGLGMVILIVTLIVLIVLHHRKKITFGQGLAAVFFVIYLYLMFGSTVFTRTSDAVAHVNTDFLWEYRKILVDHSWHYVKEVLLNMLMLVPVGFMFPLVRGKRGVVLAVFFGFVCSLSIEGLQWLFKCGLFEYDDLFNNTVGALLGYVLYRILMPWHGRKKKIGRQSKRAA